MNIRQDVGSPRFHAILTLAYLGGAAGTAMLLDGVTWGLASTLLATLATCSAAAAIGAARRDSGDALDVGFCPSCGEELDK